jgi:hypothetical protein
MSTDKKGFLLWLPRMMGEFTGNPYLLGKNIVPSGFSSNTNH